VTCQNLGWEKCCFADAPQSVTVGNGMSIPVVGIGHICVNLKLDGGHTVTTVIRDVYYVPNLDGNLLSISYIPEFNLEVTFGCNSC